MSRDKVAGKDYRQIQLDYVRPKCEAFIATMREFLDDAER
jgi:hypothetical protein